MDAVRNALITNVINNLFHVIWLICITLEPKYSRKKTVLILSAAGVFFQILAIGLAYTGILGERIYYAGYILTAIIFGAAYIFCVNMSPSKSIFLMSAYYCLWTFIYNMISIVTSSSPGAGNAAIWLLRIGFNLFFLILYQFYFKKRILLLYRDIRNGDKTITALSFLTFYMVTILVFLGFKQQSHSFLWLYIIISVYIFVILVYVVLFRFMKRLNHELELKQMLLHERLLLEQIASYEEAERNARQTRHDIRHHNIVIAEFVKNRDYEGVLDYLQKYEKEEEEKYNRTFCSNHAVDHALSAYVKRAEQNGIEVKTDIRFWDTSGISDVDLVSILANIIENSINGCMQVQGQRWLKLLITQKGAKFVIVCKNTCTSDISFENGIPKNKSRDGIGVESILRSARKYSGDADFSAEGGIFTCRVVLCN